MSRYLSVLVALSFFMVRIPTQEASAIEGVIAEGQRLELVAEGYKFTEGPASDTEGNVYFTDQPNDRILRFDAKTRTVETWLQPAGRSNGLFFTPSGRLIACADADNELWSINVADKSHDVILGKFDKKRFNGPNDCWVDSDGTIYFTDPFYKRPYWKHSEPELTQQDVYRVAVTGHEVTVAASHFEQPNGIVGDPVKRLLFVADIRAKKTYRFRIDTDGNLVDRTLHCEMGSDGMTLDQDGRLYLTGKDGVTVFDPAGNKLGSIATPEGWTANVCFGGTDRNELFITAGKGFYTIKTMTRGVGSPAK